MSTQDGDDELSTTREENARLRSELDLARRDVAPNSGGPASRGRRVLRWTAAVLVLILGILLTPVTVVAIWARSQIYDTNQYVENVAPLARDPTVQDAIAARITMEVFRAVDLDGLVDRSVAFLERQGAPEQVAALAGPVKNGLRSFTTSQVRRVVGTDEFARAWDEANRLAHEGLVAALTGDTSGGITVSGETVSVNLGAFIESIRPQLVEAGVPLADRVPEINVSFTILESSELPRIQRFANALNSLVVPLTVATVGLLLFGVLLAPNPRRMAFIAGLGIAAAMGLHLAGLTAAREYYLNHLPEGTQSADAAAAIWDTLLRFLLSTVNSLLALGLVIAALAWLVGPARPATALRRLSVSGLSWARERAAALGWRTGPVDRWVAANVGVVRAAVVVLVVLTIMVWPTPSPASMVWFGVLLLVLLAVVEFLRLGADLPSGHTPRPA